MSHKPLISAVINVRNEADKLTKCLKSLRNFADEIIVVDMHSTDGSDKIAADFGAVVYPYRWSRVVEPARNFALSKANGKWIILLDPDEYLSKTLKAELKTITQRSDVDWVKIPRKNIIFGKWLRHSRCWPDYIIRFFKNGHVIWKKEIHSSPETKGNGLTIMDSEKLAIQHHNYDTIAQFVTRAVRYSNVQADELEAAGYKLKTSDFILKPIQEFNSRFFVAEGFKDGLHGLVFSILQAFSITLIYIKVWEKQGFQDKTFPKESFVSASQETVFEYSYWFSRFFIHEYRGNIFKNIIIKIRYWFDRLTKNF